MFVTGYMMSRHVHHESEVGMALKSLHDEVFTALINSIDVWKHTHPHVILFCLLPPLLFEDAASMEFYTFQKVRPNKTPQNTLVVFSSPVSLLRSNSIPVGARWTGAALLDPAGWAWRSHLDVPNRRHHDRTLRIRVHL